MMNYKDYYKNCQNFRDLCDKIKDLDNKIKGDIFEEFTFLIFKYHNNYKLFTKNLWLFKDIPITICNKINLYDKRDIGIDILLESVDNEFYGIQCKYRNNKNKKITWNEISTFIGLSFGICNDNIKGCYLVSSSYNITNITDNNKLINYIDGYFFDNIDKNFFDKINNILNNSNISIIKKQLKQHQQIAINNISKHFETNDKCTINHACGSGKTFLSYMLIVKLNPKITLILAPSLYLISQIYNEFSTYENCEKYKFILCCSDVEICNDNNVNKALISTNKDKIKEKIILHEENIIIISTYQSSNVIKDVFIDDKINLIIFDECHKTVGDVNKNFLILINDKNINCDKKLFMTATNKIYVGNNEEILSMDNENVYGKIVDTYSLRQSIMDKNLVDYKFITFFVENGIIDNCIKENDFVRDDNIETTSRLLSVSFAILKAFLNNNIKKLITYQNTIKNCNEFKKIFKYIYDNYNESQISINIFIIDGEMSMKKRNKIIENYKISDKAMLISAKVLTEGVNIPCVDSICFIDTVCSTVNIVQSIGRALRLYDNKTEAKIIIPISYNNLMNVDEIEELKYLNKILKIMNSQDERIIEYFNDVCNNKKINKKFIKKYFITNSTPENFHKKIDIKLWFKNIQLNISKSLDNFEFYKNVLFEYVEKNNKMPSKNEIYEFNNLKINLYNWFDNYKKLIKINNDKDNVNLLMTNNIIKNNIITFLNNNIHKNNFEHFIEIFQDYYKNNNNIPKFRDIYIYREKEYEIGRMYLTHKNDIKNNIIKQKINVKDLIENKIKLKKYTTLCSIGNKIKSNIDEYISQPINQTINEEQKFEIFYKYLDVHNKIPTQHINVSINGVNWKLGSWYSERKRYYRTKIKSVDNKNELLINIFKTNNKKYLDLIQQNLDDNLKINDEMDYTKSDETKIEYFKKYAVNNTLPPKYIDKKTNKDYTNLRRIKLSNGKVKEELMKIELYEKYFNKISKDDS